MRTPEAKDISDKVEKNELSAQTTQKYAFFLFR